MRSATRRDVADREDKKSPIAEPTHRELAVPKARIEVRTAVRTGARIVVRTVVRTVDAATVPKAKTEARTVGRTVVRTVAAATVPKRVLHLRAVCPAMLLKELPRGTAQEGIVISTVAVLAVVAKEAVKAGAMNNKQWAMNNGQ